MYLNDELIILGLVFINIVIIFYIYQFYKNKYLLQIKELKDGVSLCKKELDENQKNSYADTKKSFISEQIKKIEACEKEVLRQKKRVEDVRAIAKDASAVKSKFLSNISTQLRSPVNEVIVNANILQKELQTSDSLKHVQIISQTSSDLLKIIDKLIASVNFDNSSFKLEENAVDIVKLISDIIEKQKAEAAKRGLNLRFEVDEKLPHALIIDAKKVNEIVINLVENALKFTHEGFVTVSISGEKANLLKNSINLSISVEDSGIGIDTKDQEKIFDAFSHETLALGLSINKKMAERMDGELSLKKTDEQGSIFRLYLPNVEVALTDANDICQDNVAVDFSLIKPTGANIMLIDSDKNTRDIVQQSFDHTAVHIYTFDNAKEAIEKLKKTHFDMILIDIDILCSEQSAISKVIATLSDAAVVSLVSTRVKEKDLSCVQVEIAGHLKKPLCKTELFKISLQVLNSLK